MKITSQTAIDKKLIQNRKKLMQLFKERPFSDEDTLVNLTLFMRSGSLAKLLFLDEIYREIIQIPGCIFEFGTYLGGTTVAFENLRAVHEPYNHLRRIFTFDTFNGYINTSSEKYISKVFKNIIDSKTYSTPTKYEIYLRKLLDCHEKENVMSNISKHKIICGDVVKTLPQLLSNDKSIIVALAYFDLAMYMPTKQALEILLNKMLKGSVIILDELGHPDYPSETNVFYELLASRNYTITRSKYLSDRSYIKLL